MSKVIVTGAAGFLGSYLSEALLKAGHQVVGVDNFFRGKKENLPTHDSFTFYDTDLVTQAENFRDIVLREDPDIVYHYAAINGTKYFYDIPFQVLDDNVRMTQNVLSCIVGTGVKKVVYASSSEVYGHNPPIPTPEEEFIILNAQADRDSYASSKALGEFYVMTFCKQNNIDYLIIRPFNTYGPRMDNTEYGQVIPEFIRKINRNEDFTIIGSGLQTRSFCYVEDHAKLVSNLGDVAKNEIINVGAGEELTMSKLALIIHNLMGAEFNPAHLPDRPNDTKRRQPDISKAMKHVPDYEFISLLDGLAKTILWYKERK
tara:strand:- start:1397 stop:2344 length:948 start_codon:yes stop_codon:yes gene_type:complete